MAKVSFTLKKARQLKRINHIQSHMHNTVIDVGLEHADEVMRSSKEVVPVDTGALYRSASVEPVDVEVNRVTVTMGYGNAIPQPARPHGANYAVAVHERTEVPHRIGMAKYLSIPFRVLAPRYILNLRRAVRRLFRGG